MTIIPLLATQKLGLSLLVLGAIEGGSEFISMLLRMVSGNMFDSFKNRRYLFTIPGVMSLISKSILLFPSGLSILASKVVDRIGNGLFSVPRDAYVGQVSEHKGKSLGYMNMSRSLGCILGPVIISASCYFYGSINHNITYVLIFMCLINALAFLLSFHIKLDKLQLPNIKSLSLDSIKSLLSSNNSSLNMMLLVTFMFFMGRFNDGNIMLYLKGLGYPEWFYISTIAFFNFAMLVISPFFGYCVDKGKTYSMMLLTVCALVLFNLVFYNLATVSLLAACVGLLFWGVQRVGERITFASVIFSSVPKHYYGTAIGLYSVISGLGTLLSSLICGYLAKYNFNNIFLLSGAFGIATLGLVLVRIRDKNALLSKQT